MGQMEQQPILKMEISDNFVCAQHLVGGGEVWVCLIDLGPSRGLMAERFYHHGECRKWWSTEAINNAIGASCCILYDEVELLQVCGPIMMVVILQFSLCLHEL
jgi:hypothetical protein